MTLSILFFGSAKGMMIPSTENNRTILIRSYISFLLIQRTLGVTADDYLKACSVVIFGQCGER